QVRLRLVILLGLASNRVRNGWDRRGHFLVRVVMRPLSGSARSCQLSGLSVFPPPLASFAIGHGLLELIDLLSTEDFKVREPRLLGDQPNWQSAQRGELCRHIRLAEGLQCGVVEVTIT